MLRRPQVKISLASAISLLCLTYFIMAYLSNVKRRQIEVQKVVQELGGHVWNVNFHEGGSIDPPRSSILPSVFYVILPEMYNYVYVTSPEVNDHNLAKILDLPGIEGLNISWSRITNKGLLMLKEKPGLKEIQLYGIPTLTDESILQLKASTRCTIKH
jgi:hypothetical protein